MRIITTIVLLLCFQINCQAFDYKNWWEKWYQNGKGSGAGSRNDLANFKADVINSFLAEHSVDSVVEFGCGDGVNLGMIDYPNYIGLDVSRTILGKCIDFYKYDPKKNFFLYEPNSFCNKWIKNVDLVVCLDVLYHVIDEQEYVKLLQDIFSFSPNYVILYTTLTDDGVVHNSLEIKHRNIAEYLKAFPNYAYEILPQKHPEQTRADFLILTKISEE